MCGTGKGRTIFSHKPHKPNARRERSNVQTHMEKEKSSRYRTHVRGAGKRCSISSDKQNVRARTKRTFVEGAVW